MWGLPEIVFDFCWKSVSSRGRAFIIVFLAGFVFIVLNSQFQNTKTESIVINKTDFPVTGGAAEAAEEIPIDVQRNLALGRNMQGNPPNTTVDGVTLTGKQQIEVLTQAARDAGMDEAAAQRTGLEVAILCNGNPDCLR